MDKLNEVFNAAFEQAQQVFPEFDFYLLPSGNYIDRSGWKVTHEKGNAGKVYFYANNHTTLIDYSNVPKPVLQYIQERERLDSRGAALRYLARATGVQLENWTEEEQERWQQTQRQYELRAEALQFYFNSLHTDPKAEAARQYLIARGYKMADLIYMRLGYFAGLEQLRKHLTEAGFTDDEITDTVSRQLPNGVDKGTHPIVLPYRNAAGNLAGFAYRSMLPSIEPKYLLDKGIKRGGQLYNFIPKNRTQDLVITEGLLDALIATAREVPNVAALLGRSITEEQTRQAVRHGGRITLCLDADEAGRTGTQEAISKLLQAAKEEDLPLQLYVAELPEGYKDADELITKKGAEAFSEAVRTARREIHYLQDQLLKPYDGRGELTAKEQDQLLTDIVRTAAQLRTPLDRSLFTSYFQQYFQGIVTAEALEQTAEQLAYDAQEERQKDRLTKLLKTAQKQLTDGVRPEEILQQLDAEKERAKVIQGANLLQPYGYGELVKDVLNRKEGLKTGFAQLDKVVTVKRGALTLVAGRTSHGKTTFMANLALRMQSLYKQQRFYFLSYEETKDRLLMKIASSLTAEPLDVLLPEYEELKDHADKLEAYIRERERGNRTPVPAIEKALDYLLKDLIGGGWLTVTDKKYSVEELEAIIKAEHKRHGNTAAFFIDYATKIRSTKMEDLRADIRLTVNHITYSLEQVAKDTDTAIVLGAQLNRTAAAKGNKEGQQEERPRLEQLKESGALEEAANVVLSLWNADAELTLPKDTDQRGPVTLEVQVLKNRDGRRNGTALLLFQQDRRLIRDSTPQELRKMQEQRQQTYEEKKNYKFHGV